MICSLTALPQSTKSPLETVSTVRGSGWVAVPKCEIAIDYEFDRFTHPLPRTVLTVSKRDVLTLRQGLRRPEFEFGRGTQLRLGQEPGWGLPQW